MMPTVSKLTTPLRIWNVVGAIKVRKAHGRVTEMSNSVRSSEFLNFILFLLPGRIELLERFIVACMQTATYREVVSNCGILCTVSAEWLLSVLLQ